MYTMLTNRRDDKDRDEGFTLIELMVVVLIIAILLAIAIPTFLGAQNKAKDRGAQSSARIALTNAKTFYADAGEYTGADSVALEAAEPGMDFVTGAVESAGPKSVSVLEGEKVWYAAVLSDTGTCYYIRDSVDTSDSPGTTYAKVDPATTCVAAVSSAGLVYTAAGWD